MSDQTGQDTIHYDRYYGSLAAMRARFDRRARRDAFSGGTAEEFEIWRERSRATLTSLLGLDRMERCGGDAVVDGEVYLPAEEGGLALRREHCILQTEPGIYMPFYLFIPEYGENTPDPAGDTPQIFLALPGHQGAGKESVAGRGEFPAVAAAIDRFQYDYGLRLARMGFVTACPDCRGFGERRDEAAQGDEREKFLSCSCFHLSHMAEGLGQTVCGMLVWDAMRLIDHLTERGSREGWRTGCIGCVGFSGGGMQTLWTSALDDRVTYTLISGYLYGYRDSLLTLNGNCSCNYIPHLWEHFDMGDIASLIAPGTLLVQSCREDHLNGPRGLDNVTEQMVTVRAAYRLFGAEDALFHDVCPGGHCFHPEILDRIPRIVHNGRDVKRCS